MDCYKNLEDRSDDQEISLDNFSKLTGFPLSYIKEELLLNEGDKLSLNDLRQSMLLFLRNTMQEMDH